MNPFCNSGFKEGLSVEVHTLTHPCPILAKGNFTAAANTYHGGVDLMNHIPDNHCRSRSGRRVATPKTLPAHAFSPNC